MATKNYQKPQTYEKMTDEEKINLYRGLAIILLGLMFFLFFLRWCFVNNTEYGVEVSCNGWNFICMSFSWNLKSPNSIFGDIASPFNYYAHELTVTLTIMTMVVFYLTLILVALAVLHLKKPNRIIALSSLIVSIVYSVALLGAFIVALIMNASDILPYYCSGNPACSIQSLIIIPFLVSVLIIIINALLLRKLTPKKEEEE